MREVTSFASNPHTSKVLRIDGLFILWSKFVIFVFLLGNPLYAVESLG